MFLPRERIYGQIRPLFPWIMYLPNMKIDIDDDLIQSALEISQTTLNAQDFVHKLILAYTRTEAGRGLAALGGKAPNMKEIPR